MLKAVRLPTSIPASTVSAKESESTSLVSIAIFCGIGLLVSLVAIILGVPGVWY